MWLDVTREASTRIERTTEMLCTKPQVRQALGMSRQGMDGLRLDVYRTLNRDHIVTRQGLAQHVKRMLQNLYSRHQCSSQPTAKRPAHFLAYTRKAHSAFPSAATLLSPMESTSPRPAAISTSRPTAQRDDAPATARMQAV